VRAADGRLALIGRTPAFVAEQWFKADGDARKLSEPALKQGARCDALGCTVRMSDGRAVALTNDRRAFAEDCRRAAIVISRLRAPASCQAALVIDRAFLAQHGATAVRLTASGMDVVTTRRMDEARPWLRRDESAARPAVQTKRPEKPDRKPEFEPLGETPSEDIQ